MTWILAWLIIAVVLALAIGKVIKMAEVEGARRRRPVMYVRADPTPDPYAAWDEIVAAHTVERALASMPSHISKLFWSDGTPVILRDHLAEQDPAAPMPPAPDASEAERRVYVNYYISQGHPDDEYMEPLTTRGRARK